MLDASCQSPTGPEFLIYLFSSPFKSCGDDTYVLVNNLRSYLGGTEIDSILNGTRVVFSKKQEPPGEGTYKAYTDAMAVWKGDPKDRPLLIGMVCDAPVTCLNIACH